MIGLLREAGRQTVAPIVAVLVCAATLTGLWCWSALEISPPDAAAGPVTTTTSTVDPFPTVPPSLPSTTTTSVSGGIPTTSITLGTLFGTTSTTLAALGECGDPSGDRQITATDALITLSAAVKLATCELCVCDIDGNGGIAATDALVLLGIALDIGGDLLCEPCS